MARISLTAKKLDSLKPQSRRVEYWDETTPGLVVRVTTSGDKSFSLNYRLAGLKRRMTLGTYPVLTLAKARGVAKDALELVRRGIDPIEERKRREEEERRRILEGMTVEDLAKRFLDEHAVNLRSGYEVRRVLEHDVLPVFGRIPAKELTRSQIREFLDHKALQKKKPVMANRTLAYIRKMYAWALSKDIVDYNPCAGIPRPGQEKQRDRVLTEDEIKKIWSTLDSENVRTAALIRLILVTVQRPGEVASMRWQDIKGDIWTIPAEFTKNRLSHRVPLSPLAIRILDDIRKIERGRKTKDDCPWVFPNPKRTNRMYWYKNIVQRVRLKCDVVDWVPHDLRRTGASMMTSMGYSRLVVGKILNHVEPGVTKVYDRYSYDKDKREALDAWGKRVQVIISGLKAVGKTEA